MKIWKEDALCVNYENFVPEHLVSNQKGDWMMKRFEFYN